MPIKLRSAATTETRRMAGARSLWRANGMKDDPLSVSQTRSLNSCRDTFTCTKSDNK